VLVTNNAKDLVPIVDEFGLRGEMHLGVLLTSDVTFPRTKEMIALMVRSLAAFAAGRPTTKCATTASSCREWISCLCGHHWERAPR